jgi:hypothetical protein
MTAAQRWIIIRKGNGETLLQVLRRPSMNLLTDFYIFETIPKDPSTPGKVVCMRV